MPKWPLVQVTPQQHILRGPSLKQGGWASGPSLPISLAERAGATVLDRPAPGEAVAPRSLWGLLDGALLFQSIDEVGRGFSLPQSLPLPRSSPMERRHIRPSLGMQGLCPCFPKSAAEAQMKTARQGN